MHKCIAKELLFTKSISAKYICYKFLASLSEFESKHYDIISKYLYVKTIFITSHNISITLSTLPYQM